MDQRRAIDSEQELISILKSLDPNGKMHQIYRSHSGSWHYTYSGGDAHVIKPHLVTTLVGAGVLRRVYSDTGDAYWLGPTMDIDATLAERARSGSRHAIVYESNYTGAHR